MAFWFTGANGQAGETRQGIEQARAEAQTEAEGCEKALGEASRKAENQLLVEGFGAKRRGITSKKCECREDPKAVSKKYRWGCVGLVGWEVAK